MTIASATEQTIARLARHVRFILACRSAGARAGPAASALEGIAYLVDLGVAERIGLVDAVGTLVEQDGCDALSSFVFILQDETDEDAFRKPLVERLCAVMVARAPDLQAGLMILDKLDGRGWWDAPNASAFVRGMRERALDALVQRFGDAAIPDD